MKIFSLILAILVAALLGLLWLPELAAHRDLLTTAALGGAVLLVVTTALGMKRDQQLPRKPVVSPVAASVPQASASSASQAEGVEAIGLLSAFQENGRLVDFLMDDITAFQDAQVGAAARIVHQGCRSVLEQTFAIAPVCESAEGATISVPVSYRGDEYRLSGSLSGTPPFTGTVMHRGWKTAHVKLPRTVVPEGQLPNIAPAEVEVASQ